MESHNLSGLFADRYTIERSVGRGASASVYLAHDSKQDREIALKVLDNELAHALGAKRFLQEIRITSRLQHPHILPIHDSGEWKGFLYYVLPFVAGESLRDKLDREKQLPIEECVQLTCDVASALAHAHSKGVVHRDVKPENILLSDGHALVADFGIARTIDVHTGERLTSSGLIVGTSQYMSPEQASGEREIDARSDIYSLGCVLYEMLAGIEPFVGPNVRAVIAQRFTHTPPAVTTYRPAVPEYLVQVLERALAISPADRFQTMKDFEAALPATAASPRDRRRTGRTVRDFARTRNGKVVLSAAALFLVALIAVAIPARRSIQSFIAGPPVTDSSLFVVLPMPDSSGKVSLEAETIVEAVSQRLTDFGIQVVSDAKTEEVIRDRGQPVRSLDALRLAEDVGAGKLIWAVAETSPMAATLKLYDVQSGKGASSAPLPRVDSTQRALYTLLRTPSRPSTADGGDGLTKSYFAWRSYGRGHTALKNWDLQRAESEFANSLREDPDFVPARLWLAQLIAWKHSPDLEERWGRDATFAAANAQRLALRDQHIARALGALAGKRFPEACSEYRKIIELDSMDFIGWHGTGECLFLDERVVSNSASPSGFAFRSSYASAAASYLRAISLDPGVHNITGFDVVSRLLPVSAARMRTGRDASGALLASTPSLRHDTLAFIPYPVKIFSRRSADPSRNDALDRNANQLFEFVRSWTRADARNPDAYEGLASILEVRGEITTRSSAGLTASEALTRAALLARTDRQKLRVTGSEVRLRVKRYDFTGAARLSDSLLANFSATREEPDLVATAALTGRIARMAKEAESHRNWIPAGYLQLSAPAVVINGAADFFAHAAAGDCSDKLRASEERLLTQVESYFTAERRADAIHIFTLRSRSLATPCANGASALRIAKPENALAQAQQSFAKRNFAAVRKTLDSLVLRRSNMRPGDLSLDHTYQEAWLRAAIGDTAAAKRQLDVVLNALPSLNAPSLREPGAAAALGRAMLLRGTLAAADKDRAMAARWAAAAGAIWISADQELKSQVRALADAAR